MFRILLAELGVLVTIATRAFKYLTLILINLTLQDPKIPLA